MEKKTWQKPELIPLTRCKPEEAVLSACKYGAIATDPTTYCVGCVQQGGVLCTDCEQVAIS